MYCKSCLRCFNGGLFIIAIPCILYEFKVVAEAVLKGNSKLQMLYRHFQACSIIDAQNVDMWTISVKKESYI